VLRKKIYDNVTESFKNKYDWLGESFAEEFLLSLASWNIQQHSNPEFRVRRHLVLYWAPAWFKSSLLYKGYQWLGSDLCTMMTDVTLAALRGTVEAGQFVSPFTLKRPFSICTEFGQIIQGGDTGELVQKLLNVLEEGVVTVSLGKIALLTADRRKDIAEEYGIDFIDNNTFTYDTNWVLMAGTYNRKFMVDNAFQSRFNILYPDQKLTSKLTKFVNQSPPYNMDEDTAYGLRQEITRKRTVETNVKLPDEVFDLDDNVTPRESSSLQSYVLCRAWWGIKTPKNELLDKLKLIKARNDEVWKTADDKVLEELEKAGKKGLSVKDLVKITNYTERQVYYSLSALKRQSIIEKWYDDDTGEKVWRV